MNDAVVSLDALFVIALQIAHVPLRGVPPSVNASSSSDPGELSRFGSIVRRTISTYLDYHFPY